MSLAGHFTVWSAKRMKAIVSIALWHRTERKFFGAQTTLGLGVRDMRHQPTSKMSEGDRDSVFHCCLLGWLFMSYFMVFGFSLFVLVLVLVSRRPRFSLCSCVPLLPGGLPFPFSALVLVWSFSSLFLQSLQNRVLKVSFGDCSEETAWVGGRVLVCPGLALVFASPGHWALSFSPFPLCAARSGLSCQRWPAVAVPLSSSVSGCFAGGSFSSRFSEALLRFRFSRARRPFLLFILVSVSVFGFDRFLLLSFTS